VHIVALFRSDTLAQSYGPWLVMQYAYIAIIVSMLLLSNYWLKFNETLWEPSIPTGDAHIVGLFRSDPLTQSNGPWLVMQYAYRAIIISMLLLCNYLLEFNETLLEPSKPRGDAHIVVLFWSDTLTQSYGPWLVMQYANRANFMESSKTRGDAHIIALFRSDTNSELCPLISYAVCI
jgi:glycerol-3-phosphate cytidylyltransferase-like family protein